MPRTFVHSGEIWHAELSGGGHGVGAGAPPPITRFGVLFSRPTAPQNKPLYGWIATKDLTGVSEESLRASLDEAVRDAVVGPLENPQWDWRTAEAVSRELGLPVELVRGAIETAPERFIRSQVPDPSGRALYTTRQHYSTRRSFFTPFSS